MQHEAANEHDARWGAARATVRAFAAERLGDAPPAAQLLPLHPAEHGATPAPARWPTFAALAADYPSLLDPTLRKRRGAWFTPPALALPTARRALQPLLAERNGPPLRICDPAVGAGAFLLAALQAQRELGVPTQLAAASLHGLDVDATAATLAALAVHEACGDDAPDLSLLTAQIRGGDGLLELERDTFDVVLSNPPWETLQATDEARRAASTLRRHFTHQGPGKLFTYRLFVERTHQLLRDGGRFGLVVPASLWFDRDAAPLRELLLDTCDWEWLFGFENRRRLFAIDSRYRFAVVLGAKGGRTRAVNAAFGREDVAEWQRASPPYTRFDRGLVTALSPRTGAFVEVDDERDLDILRRMHVRGRPLVGAGGALVWKQGDHNMTSHKDRFVLCGDAEQAGFRRAPDGTWRRGDATLQPLYQGAMIHDLHPNAGAFAGGVGHATTWSTPTAVADLRPQFLVAAGRRSPWPARIALRALSNATNERTAIACLLPDVPCGNSLGLLTPAGLTRTPLRELAAGAAALASLPFDYALRLRLSGTNLNGFVLGECVLPVLDDEDADALAICALRLCAILPWHFGLWRVAAAEGWLPQGTAPALEANDRARLHTEIDRRCGLAFGLSHDDVAWIARGCTQPSERLRNGTPEGLPARGFWRVDRELPPEHRRPNRWLRASAQRDVREGQHRGA